MEVMLILLKVGHKASRAVCKQELLRADLGLIPALKKRCPINAFPATRRVSLIEPGTPHY